MYTDKKPIKTKKKQSNFGVIIIMILIIFTLSYFFIFKDFLKDSNTKMEDEMVSKAKDYVSSNNISTNKEIYFDVSKLGITLDSECSLTSGVLYDGVNYTPNLVCSNYKSSVVKTNKEVSNYISLKGDDVIVLAKGMNYYDPGYNSNDIVVVVGNVGTEEGVYNIYYKTKNSNSIVNRKVIIIDNQAIRDLFPTIALNGDELIHLVQGNIYQEPGIVGYDQIDGNITSNVKTDGKVDSNVIGEYKISYTLTNSRGYSNTITRVINVISRDSDLMLGYTLMPENLTNQDVTIKLSINNEYNKIVYPDGTEGKDLSYIVSDSGTYHFMVYDMYNRIIEKDIEVNNIDKTIPDGRCVAIRYYNRTEINVSITTEKQISSYEYFINNASSGITQTNNYVSKVVKPSKVTVIVKDSINNQNEITCSLEDKLTREIVTDSKGKNCLEGMVCYIQFDYGSSKYPFCSMSNNPNSCGGIGRNGCSITSATNAIAAMGVKSKTGVLHNPWTVYDELYPINKKTGQCGGGCSGWSRIRDAVVNAGLTAPEKYANLNRDTISQVTDHLKKGYPVIIYAQGRPFSSGTAHYLSLLAIRDDGYVFLSDSANRSGIDKGTYNGKKYYVDTWVSTDDLISGNVKQFLLVGPSGMFKGKL